MPGAEALLAKWEVIRNARAEMQKAIEAEREAGRVGSSLQAEGVVRASGEAYEALKSLGDELRFVMIMSKVELEEAAEGLSVEVKASSEKKCERCWHYVPGVGTDAEHPGLCPRCRTNLFGSGEVRRMA